MSDHTTVIIWVVQIFFVQFFCVFLGYGHLNLILNTRTICKILVMSLPLMAYYFNHHHIHPHSLMDLTRRPRSFLLGLLTILPCTCPTGLRILLSISNPSWPGLETYLFFCSLAYPVDYSCSLEGYICLLLRFTSQDSMRETFFSLPF